MEILSPPLIDTLRLVLEFIATAAFALSGVIMAARKRLDVVGVCVVGFLAAFGGGTLRDVLLDQRPFFWVRHVEFVWGILALSLAAMVFMRQHHIQPTERAMQWPDTIGLGLFAAVGTDLASALGMPALVAVMMGVTTGVFGGVLRDMFCKRIPLVFQKELYAGISFASAVLYIALQHYVSSHDVVVIATLLFGFTARLLALRLKLGLPVFHYTQDTH